jgi:branched-chain amino acid transport system ATP-binding protein
MSESQLLSIEDLQVSYGDITVIREASATVNTGSVVTIVGTNGAGKTTLLKTIAGIKDPDSGSVRFDGEEIAAMKPYEIVQRGLAYVPERHRIFPEMTVRENLITATSPVQDRDNDPALDRVFELFPILDERRGQRAETMSGGQQQMLAIAQGLVVEPELILLDEPTLGLAPQIVDDIRDTIVSISEQGVTVLLVDEDIEMAKQITDEMYLLQQNTLQYLGERGEFEEAYEENLQKTMGGDGDPVV